MTFCVPKKVLITGATGFLGSRLALNCIELGFDVHIITRQGSDLRRLEHAVQDLTQKQVCLDYNLVSYVNDLAPDIIIHTACAYGNRGESLSEISDANYRYGLLVLQAVFGLKKNITFINAGTALRSDANLYAMTKNFFSQVAASCIKKRKSKVSFIDVKLQNFYGPGDDTSKFTSWIIRACADHQPEIDLSSGEQLRDFIYIDDVISAFRAILNCTDLPKGYSSVGLGTGSVRPVKDFVVAVHRIARSKSRLRFGVLQNDDHERTCDEADVTFLKSIGWRPMYSAEDGIRTTLNLEYTKCEFS